MGQSAGHMGRSGKREAGEGSGACRAVESCPRDRLYPCREQ